MSFPEQKNPFASPVMPPPQAPVHAAGYPSGIEYLRSYNYIFENPNWAMNVLWGFLCILSTLMIPFLGNIVFLGYQFEVIQVLLATGGARYPDFDINRFGDYLSRGIWPLLVQMLVSIPLAIVAYVGVIVVILLAAAAGSAGGDTAGPILAVFIGGVGMLAMVGLFVAVMLLLVPMMIRAGLQQDFAAAFDFGWASDFVKRMWVEIILVALFVQLTGFVLVMLGFFALCVGVYAAAAIVMLAYSHLWYQLYLVFLGRGGKPIPIKPLSPMMPPQHI
jgi:hypothetical protein